MMNSFYWLIAALFLLIGLFQIYLVFTDQHVHFHWQNTSNEKKPEPTWRNGRAWFSLSYNDDNKSHKYYPSPTLHPWWHLFHKSLLEFKVYLAAEEFDIQFFIGFLFGSIGLQLAGTRFFRWLFQKAYRMGWGYGTGFDFDPWRGHLTFHLAYNDMASGPGFSIKFKNRRWMRRLYHRYLLLWNLPRKKLKRKLRPWLRKVVEFDPLPPGVHLWRSVDYIKGSMPTGGGWYCSIDFDRIIRGSYEREVENIGEAETREIPIEPDHHLGLHYFATFQRQKEIRWRGHLPWRKTITYLVEIETDAPPMHAGKGENSYDQDDDGIFGWAPEADTIEEAITKYQEHVYADRKKYGMPDVIYRAQKGAN